MCTVVHVPATGSSRGYVVPTDRSTRLPTLLVHLYNVVEIYRAYVNPKYMYRYLELARYLSLLSSS